MGTAHKALPSKRKLFVRIIILNTNLVFVLQLNSIATPHNYESVYLFRIRYFLSQYKVSCGIVTEVLESERKYR